MVQQFDHERLDVYRLALGFISWLSLLEEELTRAGLLSRVREIWGHLDRASLSALFNTAEGNGKRQAKSRAAFFDIARGSTTEAAACLDALVAKGCCSNERIQEGKDMLVRIFSMLTRLVDRFENLGTGSRPVKEVSIEYETDA